jgi:hypothetical protein
MGLPPLFPVFHLSPISSILAESLETMDYNFKVAGGIAKSENWVTEKWW